MRIRVKDILNLLASGASTEEILEDYPYLEAGDIRASLEYAAHQMDHPILSVAYGFWQPMDTLREKNHLEDLWASGRAPWKVW